MNPLFSNMPTTGPMTQTNAAEPLIGPTLRERLREPIELPERIVMEEPMHILHPKVYEAMEEKGYIKDGYLTKSGYKFVYG